MRKKFFIIVLIPIIMFNLNCKAEEEIEPTIQENKIVEANGEKYCFNQLGEIQVGFQIVDGKTYFFSRDKTRYGVMRTGKFQIGDDIYIFNPELKTSLFEYEGEKYYANEEGKLQLGFQDTENGTIFLSRDRTRYGVMRTGKFQIGDDIYIFNPELKTSLFEYEGEKYYANEEGKLQLGFQETENGTIFLSRDKTRYGIMRTGKFQIGDDIYIFNPELKTSLFEYEGDKYYANEEGKLQLGFQETENGTIFLSRDKTRYGVMRTGKFQIGDDIYIFDPELKTSIFEYEGEKYYANEEGKLQLGFQETENGTIFLSRDKTRYGVMRTGTFFIGYNEYTFNEDGYLIHKQYIPYYYNQKDSRWNNKKYGGKKFGSTGCAPTSMAMAFTAILEREILPTTIGDYLYYNTNEFNKKTSGSSGMAIKYATEHYHIKMTPIKTKEEMIEQLKDGKIIFAAMGEGKFATNTYNHAILLYKYDNNKTFTMAADPLKTVNNNWVSIDRIFNEQSKDPDDSTAGSNFYALEKDE